MIHLNQDFDRNRFYKAHSNQLKLQRFGAWSRNAWSACEFCSLFYRFEEESNVWTFVPEPLTINFAHSMYGSSLVIVPWVHGDDEIAYTLNIAATTGATCNLTFPTSNESWAFESAGSIFKTTMFPVSLFIVSWKKWTNLFLHISFILSRKNFLVSIFYYSFIFAYSQFSLRSDIFWSAFWWDRVFVITI